MATTYELIASYTFPNSSSGSYTFTSIPQTYTDLIVRTCGKDSLNINAGRGQSGILFNTQTSDYSHIEWYAIANLVNSAAASNNATGFGLSYQGASSGNQYCYGVDEAHIPNYATNLIRTYWTEGVSGDTSNSQWGYGGSMGYRSNNAAVTTLTVYAANAQNFIQYSTLYLYGIKHV